ncbi:MAG: nucleotidyltransferase family protein [Sphingopyxis sp.]|nr:nucleotidyltransferase family protein [Sphingopyxis sp.]
MRSSRLVTSGEQAVPAAARTLHALLLSWFNHQTTEVDEEHWNSVRHLAQASKTLGLIGNGLDPNSAGAHDLRHIKTAILEQNLRNLRWTTKVAGLLQGEGIAALAFKGVPRSHEVYGSWDSRPSNDVDILVDPSDYRGACATLQQNGYRLQVSDKSVWWHRCLGEAPFRHEEQHSPYIDLHHQLQQPGGPYPNRLPRFFADCRRVAYGKTELCTPSANGALLIAVINYGKAMRAGEPTLARLHEISYATRSFGDDGVQQLLNLAALQGFENLAAEALEKANILFPHTGQIDSDTKQFDAVLLESLAMTRRPMFLRTRFLWAWTDGRPPLRLIRFCASLLRLLHSGVWRWIESKTGRVV